MDKEGIMIIMDKEVIIIIIDEIMVVNNHIMAMVLDINVVAEEEEEEIMEVVNNGVKIRHITEIQTNECKLIRSRKKIFVTKNWGCICLCVWTTVIWFNLSFSSSSFFCLSFVRISRHFLYLPSEHFLFFFFYWFWLSFSCCFFFYLT